MCELSPEAIEARRERDALQAKLDIAINGLEWYASSPAISGDAVAIITLEKIRKEA
jgi:hypothetical protein